MIFDLDGTLLDTSAGIVESVRHAVARLGFPALSQKQFLSFIGPPLQDSFRRCCGCTEAEAEALTEEFRVYYSAGAVLNAVPYDGIEALCEALRARGVPLAVATAKPQAFSGPLLRHFGLDRFFAVIRGPALEGGLRKPDLIRLCVEDLGADAEKCVMVGDTEHDAAGAQLAGVPFLAVRYGFGDAEKMLRCPHVGVADTPGDILRILTEREENAHA